MARFWNITIGEPIIADGDDVRLHRAGQMCSWLSRRGHDVTFINSTFSHQKRVQRFPQTSTLHLSKNFRVVCLLAREYQRSISFARFASHRDCAFSFKEWLKTSPEKPDAIIVSYPVVELCEAALCFAKQNNIPLIIDCRDFWPDIFSEVLPFPIRWLGKLIFFPFELQARKALSRATAICGHTESAMKWGIDKAGRGKNNYDFFFPFTFPASAKDEYKPFEYKPFCKNAVKICFVGTLSHRSGLEKYITAIGALPVELKAHIRMLVAGSGPHMAILKNLVEKHNAPVEFLGWIDQSDIISLIKNSDFGLLPYDRPDFHLSLPNKLVDYISGGLPILTCTGGEVKKFIEVNKAGVWTDIDEICIKQQLQSVLMGNYCFNRSFIRKVYEKQFSPEKVFGIVEDVLIDLHNQKEA